MRVWNAAGTWDILYKPDFPYDVYVHKTLTLEECKGEQWNWTPWGNGIVNQVGLTNTGVDRFRAEVKHRLPVASYVSILGFSFSEWRILAGLLFDMNLELNFSCPNVEGTMDLSCKPKLAETIVGQVRALADNAIGVKLAPHTSMEVVHACEVAGVDYFAISNTLKTPRGGLSGKALQPFALELIEKVRDMSDLPIVGMGGIDSDEDVEAFLAAGATDIAIGTGHLLRGFQNPLA